MFEKFAKLHGLRPPHQVPRVAPANDNSRGALRPDAGRVRRSPPLVCRWSDEQGLTCHWEVDGTDGRNPLLDDEPRPGSQSDSGSDSRFDSWSDSWSDDAIHKSVVGPSYTAHGQAHPAPRCCCRRVTSSQESIAWGHGCLAIANYSQVGSSRFQ